MSEVIETIEIIQGTPEWKQLRLGKVTASRVKDVMARIKTGEAAVRRNYRAQLVAERLSGQPDDGFSNAAMQRGTEQEPFARAAYEMLTGNLVEQVAFIDHPEIEMAGASPDGLIGSDGLVEIKNPNTSTHIGYALDGRPPAEYRDQMLWQMECCGRDWCDFVSFDSRMPEHMQLFVVRYHRDQERIDIIKDEVIKFLYEVEVEVQKLNDVFKRGAA